MWGLGARGRVDWSLVVPAAVGAALAVPFAIWAVRRARRAVEVRVAEPPEPRVMPLVREPDEAALAALPTPLRACPDCGYVGIRPASMLEGAYAGGGELLSIHVCPHCGYRGPPAEFDDADAYREYVAGLRRARRPKER